MFSFFRRSSKTKDEDNKKSKANTGYGNNNNNNNNNNKTTATAVTDEDKTAKSIKSLAAKSIIVPLKGNAVNRIVDDDASVKRNLLPSNEASLPCCKNSENRREDVEVVRKKVLNSESNTPEDNIAKIKNVKIEDDYNKAPHAPPPPPPPVNNLNVGRTSNDDKTALKNLKSNFNVKTFEDKLAPLKERSSLNISCVVNNPVTTNTNNHVIQNELPNVPVKRDDSLIYIDEDKESSVDRHDENLDKLNDTSVTPENIRNLLNLLERNNNNNNNNNNNDVNNINKSNKIEPSHLEEFHHFDSQEDNFGTAPSSPTDDSQFLDDSHSSITIEKTTRRFNDETVSSKNLTNDEKVSDTKVEICEYIQPSSEIVVELTTVNPDETTSVNTARPVELEFPIISTPTEDSVEESSPLVSPIIVEYSEDYEQIIPNTSNGNKIPDIRIIECSDSDGENEVIFYCDDDSLYHDHHPSILSDIEEDDEPFSDASDVELDARKNEGSMISRCRRNVVHQETKFQDQIKRLTCDVEVKEVENTVLKQKITELERDLDDHRRTIEHYVNENKSQKLEELRSVIDQLRFRIKNLECELNESHAEREKLQSRYIDLKSEKEAEIKLIQQTLEDVEFQKKTLEDKFRKEYETLRTVNTDREQHLLDDFEWKLREVEQSCKRKLEDKEKATTDKLSHIQTQLTSEIEKLKNELDKLRTYESELVRLKNVSVEEQKLLKTANKTIEQLQMTESQLNDEVDKLRSALEKERNYLATVQGIHSREIAEKDRKHQFRLEQQRNELITEWEDKVRRELTRLRLELEKNYKEEKRSLTEELKQKYEKELKDNNQMWEKKLFDTRKEIDRLNQKFSKKEEYYREELLKMQTNSDRDMLELRRKIDKLDMSYQERLEKKDEQYEKETESLTAEYEQRLRDCEEHWSQQMNTTTVSFETVKQELQYEFTRRLDDMEKKHVEELEKQHNELVRQKEVEISQLQTVHSEQMQEFQQKYEEELKSMRLKENELIQMNKLLNEDINKNAARVKEIETSFGNASNTYSASLEQKNNEFKQELELALKKRENEHNKLILELKDHYEIEINHLQSKVNELYQSPQQPKSGGYERDVIKPENSIMPAAPTRSSRRKGRGRHKGNKQYQNGSAHLNKQFSSSSL